MNGRAVPVVTAAICAWCTYVFIGMQSTNLYSELAKFGCFHDRVVFRGNYLPLVSMAFVHREPMHFIFNAYWMWILGGAFERKFGPVLLAVFVLAAAWISSGIELSMGQMGIGLSGVGFALFGFGWAARAQVPEFQRILNDTTVKIFIGWGIFCVFATYAKIMNVANLAHAAGAAFGIAVASFIYAKEWRVPAALGLVLLSVLSVATLIWNPKSPEWVLVKAEKAMAQNNDDEAIRWLIRGTEMNEYPAYSWLQLAEIYGRQKNVEGYKDAIENLRAVDRDSANAALDVFGPPENLNAPAPK